MQTCHWQDQLQHKQAHSRTALQHPRAQSKHLTQLRSYHLLTWEESQWPLHIPPQVCKITCSTEFHPLLHLSGNQPQQTARQFFSSTLLSLDPLGALPHRAQHPTHLPFVTPSASFGERERSCCSLETERKGKLRFHSLRFSSLQLAGRSLLHPQPFTV